MLATVITCPRRWEHYRRCLRNFAALDFGFPLQTFQTAEANDRPRVNNNLNARAALAYAYAYLPDGGWLLYLEDDVVLSPRLPAMLPLLVELGGSQNVDCWNLCNRKNLVERRCEMRGLVVNELAYLVNGANGLLIPKHHLARMLAAHWPDISDLAKFSPIHHPGWKMWQVVRRAGRTRRRCLDVRRIRPAAIHGSEPCNLTKSSSARPPK